MMGFQPTRTSFNPFMGSNNRRLGLFEMIYRYTIYLKQASTPVFVTSVACLVVFCMWQVPIFQSILLQHFVTSRYNIKEGRLLALILSGISHSDLLHLVFNLMAFVSFGPTVQHTLDSYNRSHDVRWSLWPFLVASQLAGSIFFLAIGSSHSGGAIGLSSVVMSILALYGRFYPDQELRILLAGFIPIRLSAHQLLQLSLLWSLVGSFLLTRGPNASTIGHTAHLGGLLFGMGYYELWRQRFLSKYNRRKFWGT